MYSKSKLKKIRVKNAKEYWFEFQAGDVWSIKTGTDSSEKDVYLYNLVYEF